jgi:hypothetical protein
VSIAEIAIPVLERAGIPLDAGLTVAELANVESTFGFRFSTDHAEFLSTCVPSGDGWVDWRGTPEALWSRLGWPAEGVLFDVEHSAYWTPRWGPRPAIKAEAIELARSRLEEVPRLVPLYSHRYMPAGWTEPGAPVFSVYQTDVIIYGDDLLDYFEAEFGPRRRTSSTPRDDQVRAVPSVDFWTGLVTGEEGGTQFW